MKVIARPIGTGKTKELIECAAKENGIILTLDKRALQVKAKAYGFENLDIIDLDDLYYDEYDYHKPLFINKMEDIVEELFKAHYDLKLAGFTVRLEE